MTTKFTEIRGNKFWVEWRLFLSVQWILNYFLPPYTYFKEIDTENHCAISHADKTTSSSSFETTNEREKLKKYFILLPFHTFFSVLSSIQLSVFFTTRNISRNFIFFFVLNSWLGWAEEWWKKWERKKSFMIQLLVEKKIQFRANKNLIRIRHKSPLWWILIHETSSSFFSRRYSLKKLDTLRNWKKCWTMMRAMINEILISFMRILTLDGLKRSLNLITNQTLFSHWWWRLTAQLEFDL